MPKVSIIMPAYNVEQYIRECMDSVVSQTLTDIEIIAVDDGSTDSTGRILDEYAAADKRVRVIHKKNSGYGASMNVGLNEAEGDYIGIVETDDFAESRMFERLYDTAVKFDADTVKCNFYKYYTNKEPHDVFAENLKDVELYNEPFAPVDHPKIFRVSPSIWSCLYRRKMIEDNGIRFLETPGASYQDTSFSFKVWACSEKVVLIKDPLLHYRQDNISSSINSEGKLFCVCDEYEEIERFLDEHPDKKEAFESIKNTSKFITYIWNYVRLGLEYKYVFLLRMKEEIMEAEKASKIDRDSMTERQRMRLNELLYDRTTENYIQTTKRKLLNKHESIKELADENKMLKKKLARYEEPLYKKLRRAPAAGVRRIRKLMDK